MSHYIVQSAAACMPSSCRGTYRRVAVLEVEDDVERAAMISPRARGVIRVVRTWERRNVGRTSRCAYAIALAEAEALAAELGAYSSIAATAAA
jgi:hypothetical protein